MERDAFREAVFARDGNQCVVPWCDHYAVDAHHLMERALWKDGGYHPDNGVSVCTGHHKEAEENLLSPDDLRKWAGITKVILPEGLDENQEYDKWGRVKYPRTLHLPWSPGRTEDDKVLDNLDGFEGREIVVLEKMDGENTTIRRDGTHARSLDTGYHPTRTWVRNLQGKMGWEIPEGWRICGENLQGKHAIAYSGLPSFFLVFSIWDDRNRCMSWDHTVHYCDMLGLTTVPVIWRGDADDFFGWNIVHNLHNGKLGNSPAFSEIMEGYVVRVADEFEYSDFSTHVGKYVRADHVDPAARHWKTGATEFNELA
jgi:hypothetical protein